MKTFYIDTKITTWIRQEILAQHRDKVLKFFQVNPGASYEEAVEALNISADAIELAALSEDMTPSENGGEPTIEVVARRPDGVLETLWDNTPAVTETPALSTLKTNDEIKEGLRKLLANNGYKQDGKHARTAEHAFLQGLIFGNPEYAKRPHFAICMMSGQSILSLGTPNPPAHD